MRVLLQIEAPLVLGGICTCCHIKHTSFTYCAHTVHTPCTLCPQFAHIVYMLPQSCIPRLRGFQVAQGCTMPQAVQASWRKDQIMYWLSRWPQIASNLLVHSVLLWLSSRQSYNSLQLMEVIAVGDRDLSKSSLQVAAFYRRLYYCCYELFVICCCIGTHFWLFTLACQESC